MLPTFDLLFDHGVSRQRQLREAGFPLSRLETRFEWPLACEHIRVGRQYVRISPLASLAIARRPARNLPGVWHYAIAVGQRHLGLDDVAIELQADGGLRVVSPTEFAGAAQEAVAYLRVPPEHLAAAHARLRVLAARNPRWTLLYTCEGAAFDVATGTPRAIETFKVCAAAWLFWKLATS